MSNTHSRGHCAPPHRVLLQKRLVHLIAGLRLHQVEEAMQLLIDYIDERGAPNATESGELRMAPAIPGVRGPRPHHHVQTEVTPEIVPMALCEAKKLALRPGQPYVFLPALDCESCKAELAIAVESYGLDTVRDSLIASRAFVDEPWQCQTGDIS